MKKCFLILVFLMGLCGLTQGVYADSPAPSLPQRFDSANGQYYVEMVSDDTEGFGYGSGTGTAYRMDDKGTAEELWSVNFYSSQAVLTNDGRHLITLGPLASDMTNLAIAFYQDGKEMKRYQIKELIRDESKLEPTASHFLWLSDHPNYAAGLSEDEKEYTLNLIDGSVYVFDVVSGQILQEKHPPIG